MNHDVVVAVTYNPEIEKFLLVKRAESRDRYPGEWEFPSGFLEDETEREGALRELEEETGLIGKTIKTAEPFTVESGEYHFTIHPVLVIVESDEVELTREHDKFEWVKRDQIDGFETVPQLEKDMRVLGV
ncbi:MAG: NUDIX domain-containing protein [Nanohaloarchaea archaeon]|nr:NUDIX domain-containing protein [Candidatus Nanohaloarchaea archaeon]